MTTNLIFKRQIVLDGISKTITRIVPVEVPHINSGEGWVLSGHTDSVEVVDDCVINIVSEKPLDDNSSKIGITDIAKFESSVPGTAKLVRSKGVIKIVARRGKTVFNQTTKDSVCISDAVKRHFFKECTEYFGYNSDKFEFDTSCSRYDYWNNFIDEEYLQQKKAYIRAHNLAQPASKV